MAEVQNSNPTILSAADLPTRSRSSEKKQGDHELGIFAAVPQSTDFLSSDSEGDEDLLEEPIDEQEIYGMPPDLSFFFFFSEYYVISPPQHLPHSSSSSGLTSTGRLSVRARIPWGGHIAMRCIDCVSSLMQPSRPASAIPPSLL